MIGIWGPRLGSRTFDFEASPLVDVFARRFNSASQPYGMTPGRHWRSHKQISVFGAAASYVVHCN